MNEPPDESLEQLIRARATRLRTADPAWRAEILAPCQSETPRHRQRLLPLWAWGAIAACWTGTVVLNLDTSRIAGASTPGSAGSDPSVRLLQRKQELEQIRQLQAGLDGLAPRSVPGLTGW